MASTLPESLVRSLEATKCEYVQLGQSGLRVSVPIFGAMSLGDSNTLEWAANEEEVMFASHFTLHNVSSSSPPSSHGQNKKQNIIKCIAYLHDSLLSQERSNSPLQSLPLLKAAYDIGLNTWDTANVYSNGASETIIGKAIKKYNLPRHKLVILTKCFGAVGEEPKIRGVFYPDEMRRSKDYVNQMGTCFLSSVRSMDEV